MQRFLALVLHGRQADPLHLIHVAEHKVRVVTWDPFNIAIVLLDATWVFDERAHLRIFVQFSSATRLD